MKANRPELVTEISPLFERYEQALNDKNVRFWHSPHAIRYSFDEHSNGLDKIHAHRVWRPPGPGTKEERDRHKILTLGDDSAAVNLEFKIRGQDLIGRQSQTWVRFPDLGWTVVAPRVHDGLNLQTSRCIHRNTRTTCC